jgi:hypothetical protein
MTKHVPLDEFRVSDDNLMADDSIKEAYNEYTSKRYDYSEALKELNKAIKVLHDLLDEPFRLS